MNSDWTVVVSTLSRGDQVRSMYCFTSSNNIVMYLLVFVVALIYVYSFNCVVFVFILATIFRKVSSYLNGEKIFTCLVCVFVIGCLDTIPPIQNLNTLLSREGFTVP